MNTDKLLLDISNDSSGLDIQVTNESELSPEVIIENEDLEVSISSLDSLEIETSNSTSSLDIQAEEYKSNIDLKISSNSIMSISCIHVPDIDENYETFIASDGDFIIKKDETFNVLKNALL